MKQIYLHFSGYVHVLKFALENCWIFVDFWRVFFCKSSCWGKAVAGVQSDCPESEIENIIVNLVLHG